MKSPLRSGNDRQAVWSVRSHRPFERCFAGAVLPEGLEARRLLSAIVVANTHDSGRESSDGRRLRRRTMARPSGLQASSVARRSPSHSAIDIAKNLTIAGPMDGGVMLSGGVRCASWRSMAERSILPAW